MAYFPISHTVPQYMDASGDAASGYVLKAYSSGTLTNISMATDSTGGTTVATISLNASGYPEVSGTVVIPYINEKYKLGLYTTQAAADADTGAIWIPDTIPISGDFLSATREISTATSLDSSDNFTHINASGTNTITLPDIDVVGSGFVFTGYNSGSGIITWDGNGAETLNGSASIIHKAGQSGMFISGAENWSVLDIKNGSMVQLSQQVITADASVVFDNTIITSLYTKYVFMWEAVVPVVAGNSFRMLMSVDNGSTYLSAYKTNYETNPTGSNSTSATGSVTSLIILAPAVQANGSHGRITLSAPANASLVTCVYGEAISEVSSARYDGGNILGSSGVTTTAVNAIKFNGAGATLTTGTITCYGIE